jgi:hypothetical protein
MSYLIFVAAFGTIGVFFLWIRDARIFYRTGLPGYRTAAYRGVVYGAIALLGFLITYFSEPFEVVGLGIILAALYLQGRDVRERPWKNETKLDRLLGRAEIKPEKKRTK